MHGGVSWPQTATLDQRIQAHKGPIYKEGVKMSRPSFSTPSKIAIIVALTAGLAGCADGKFKLPSFGNGAAAQSEGETTANPQTQSVALVERDVEAPEVFEKADKGLWDGRPSLGGVWVAHEGVSDPERVIIRNKDNGKFVIGALFRKEAAIPGPKFQVSSDAAQALGMLAGAPANLTVTALRREEAPAATPAPGQPPEGAPATAVAASALPADAPSPAPQTSSLAKPYVQLGIFSVKANAERTVTQMRASGLNAQMIQSNSAGKTIYRVVLGPAQTSAARAELLAKAKAQGFTDAYFVTN